MTGLGALFHAAGNGWTIEHDRGLDVWTAERSSGDGRQIHYIVRYTAAELAVRLEAADQEAPSS